MNRSSYAGRTDDRYCAICGARLCRGDDCFDTELGPVCMADACVYRYLRECGGTVEEAGTLLGMERKVWAEDRL